MDTKSALSTAGALVLVVAGGASALAAGRSGSEPATVPEPNSAPVTTIITEYVDSDGNPVAAPGSEPTIEIRSLESDGGFIVVETVEPAVVWIDAPGAPVAGSSDEYEDDDHDDEYEDEEHEDDDHHDEDDEYEDEEHEDDDDDD